MADLNYTVGINVTGAQSNLDRLQNSIARTNAAFSGLRQAVAGLAIGSFIAQSYQYANALTDAATAAGVSTRAILALSDAVQANGGSADAAVNGVGRFAQFIETAANGSKEAQDTFLKLGISLSDIGRLSEEDLLRLTIKRLGEMQSATQRLSTGVQIFGKQFRSVDFAGVANGLNKTYQEAGRTAAGVEAAGQASQNFSNAINTFRVELLSALKPISEVAVSITSNTEAVKTFIDVVLKIGAVALTFTALGKIVQALKIAWAGLATAAGGVSTAVSVIGNGIKNFGAIVSNLKLVPVSGQLRVIGTLFSEMLGWLSRLIPAFSSIGLLIYSFSDYISAATTKVNEYVNSLADMVPGFRAVEQAIQGWMGADGQATANQEINAKIRKQIMEETMKGIQALAAQDQEAARTAFENSQREAEARRKVQDAIENQRQKLADLVSGYQQEYQINVQRYQMETSLIGAAERTRNITQEAFNLRVTYLQKITQLQEEYNRLIKSGSETDARLAEEVARAMGQLTAEYERQAGSVNALADARTRAQQAEQLNQFSIQSSINLNKQLRDIQDDYARNTMTAIERKYYDIEVAARESALAAIAAEESRRGEKLNATEVEQYYATARRGIESVKAATAGQYQASRSFSAGWTKAFNDYADSATNAAQRAQNIFQKFTTGMEDLIVNFAKTGKFEWKNFVSMMLEELLRAQIQATMASVLGSMRGTMGNTAAMSMAGQIQAPRQQQQSGGLLGGIGSLIGSIGSGISSLFGGGSTPAYEMGPEDYAGFFAKGGTLGAGKWGIAGEAGPEIVRGPATITPVQPSNVVYNINAVDARSFQELLASDPKFLYAVTEQGRRSVPGGR